MAIFCCETKQSCASLAVIASVILGVVAAFLRITAVITVTPAFLWVALSIAVVYLLALTVSARCCGCCGSSCTLSAVLAGIVGTALTSVILLAISFPATSIVGAVLVGVLILSLSLIIGGSTCLASQSCGCRNNG